MGVSKTENFSKRQNDIAVLMKALAHPARIAIVEYLLKTNSCVCGDIVDKLPLAQATVSQHLKELKGAGIIRGEITGSSVCYCINDATWKRLKGFLDVMFTKYERTQEKQVPKQCVSDECC
jgi:ArsR family transcriptional regulator, arsenate/arsenite/antimonite-responsive transcriptional repressor